MALLMASQLAGGCRRQCERLEQQLATERQQQSRQEHQQRQRQALQRQLWQLNGVYQHAARENQRLWRWVQHLPAQLPQGVWLTGMQQQPNALLLEGCSLSMLAIGPMVRELSQQPAVAELRWRELAQQHNGAHFFSLELVWHLPGSATLSATEPADTLEP